MHPQTLANCLLSLTHRINTCSRIALFLVYNTFPQRTPNNRTGHCPAPVDALTTPGLAIPCRRTANELRPKRIGPALNGASGIHPALAPCIQKNATLVGPRCQYLVTVIQTPQVATPEPAARQLQRGANSLGFFITQVHVILIASGAALSTLRA